MKLVDITSNIVIGKLDLTISVEWTPRDPYIISYHATVNTGQPIKIGSLSNDDDAEDDA